MDEAETVEEQGIRDGRRRRARLLAVVVAVAALAVAVGILLPQFLRPTPVPVVPEPASPTPTPTATPEPTQLPGGASWQWVARPGLPSHGVLLAAAYASATLDGSDYYIAEPSEDESCPPLRGYRYQRAAGAWEELTISQELTGDFCQVGGVYAGQDAVYVRLVGRTGTPDDSHATTRLIAFRPATGSWERMPDFPGEAARYEYGQCVGLATGIFCYAYDIGDGSFPGDYAVFDFAAGSWRLGRSADLAALTLDNRLDFSGVSVDGRALVLVVDYRDPLGTGQGEATVSLLDPESGAVTLRTSHELRDAPRQVAAPGIVYFGPETVLAEGSEATLLDLRSGRWWSLEVPGSSPRPAETLELYRHPRSAEWASRVYGDEVAGYLVIRDYLYDPTADRWLALPVIDVSPPWLELTREEADADEGDPFDELWIGTSPRQCAWQELGPCHELQALPLDRLAQPLTHAEVMARPTTVR
ncbi:MAG: hypothetical protein AAGC63_04120 [Propionicimonas sp.]